MNKNITFAIISAALLVGGAFYYVSPKKENSSNIAVSSALVPLETKFLTGLTAKFEILSQNGNSQCSGAFKNSIASMPDSGRLQGSCCSPMNLHRYIEQVEGLKKYGNIPEIPPDPYDIDAKLAREMISYYDTQLTPDGQKAYDYAMLNSNEKGPCCCKCWRWYVYGGLGKYLIKNYGFTGEQVKEVWNLSDGCGGEGDHVQH